MSQKVMITRVATVLLMGMALTGCSTMKGWFAGKDAAAKKAQEPAELVKFEPTVKVSKVWSVNLGKGERRVVVQPIAVKQDGTRVPAVERLCEKFLQAPPATPLFRPEQRNDLFTHAVEPTLQRELKHKGAANGDGSYSAELIGYVEIIGREA